MKKRPNGTPPMKRLVALCFIASVFLCSAPCHAITIDTFDSEGIPVYLDEAVKTAPDQYASKLESDFRDGNLDAVLAIGRHLLTIRPDDPTVKSLVAIALISKGDISEARELRSTADAARTRFYTACFDAMIAKASGQPDKAIAFALKAVAADKTHPYPHNILGRVYLETDQRAKAIQSFKKAITLNTAFLPGYANLGAAYYLSQDYPAAIGYFTEGVRRSPGSFNCRYGLAMSLEASGNVTDAIAQYAESLNINPDSREALAQLSSLQLKNGMFRQALDGGKKMEAVEMVGAEAIIADASLHLGDEKTATAYIGKMKDDAPEKAFLKGYQFLLAGRYDEARRQMAVVLKENPRHFGAFSAVRVLDIYQGKKVSLTADQIDEWGPAAAKLLYFIDGTVAAGNGDWRAAHADWLRAQGLFQGFSMDGLSADILAKGIEQKELRHLNMGVLLYFRNFYTQSLAAFNEALDQNPASIFANYFSGHLNLKTGEREEAADRFAKATERAPRFFAALYAAGELKATKGKFDDAVALYGRAAEVRPDPGVLIKLGLLNEMKGDHRQAETMYQRVIEKAPDNFIGYNQLAWLYTRQGINLDKAIRLAARANSLQPGNASIQDTLGWAYFQKKDYPQATRYLESAKGVDANNPTILYHLGALYHAVGDDDKAKAALTAALEQSKGFDEAEEAEKLLSEIP